jgi:hypothetical protein
MEARTSIRAWPTRPRSSARGSSETTRFRTATSAWGSSACPEFIERNGGAWIAPGQQELAQTIERLADRTMSEEEFIVWVRAHVREEE